MTRLEMRSWAGLIVSGLIFFWFQQRMLDGWQVVNYSSSDLLAIAIGVAIASIVGFAITEGVIAGLTRDKTAEDERDALIESKSMRNELIVIVSIIYVVAFQAIMNDIYDTSPFSRLVKVDLGHLPSLVFVLFTTLWIGEFVRLVSTLAYSRSP